MPTPTSAPPHTGFSIELDSMGRVRLEDYTSPGTQLRDFTYRKDAASGTSLVCALSLTTSIVLTDSILQSYRSGNPSMQSPTSIAHLDGISIVNRDSVPESVAQHSSDVVPASRHTFQVGFNRVRFH